MKKLAVTMLIVFLLSFCLVSFAESIDLESMEMEQLISLDLQIRQKIYESDPFSDYVLYPGNYIVGSDLDAGEYIFYCVSLMPDEIYTKIFHYDANETLLDDTYLVVEDSYRMRLTDGHRIKMDDGVVTFIKR